MKSFIAYPFEFENLLYPHILNKNSNRNIADHSFLFKRIQLLDGLIVKCGISPQEGFTRFEYYLNIADGRISHKMVAFEKPLQHAETPVENATVVRKTMKQKKVKLAVKDSVEFVAGDVCQMIPEYLIENPEVKIALLNIDLNDYESTTTAMEFLYPRLVRDGILLIENFARAGEEKNAILDYFAPAKPRFQSLSDQQQIHYIIKD